MELFDLTHNSTWYSTLSWWNVTRLYDLLTIYLHDFRDQLEVWDQEDLKDDQDKRETKETKVKKDHEDDQELEELKESLDQKEKVVSQELK